MVRKAKHMEETLLKKRSQMRDIWRRFKSNKLAMVGLVIVVVIVLSAVFADVITPYEYSARSSDRLVFPCLAHPFGTDNYGRDLALPRHLRWAYFPAGIAAGTADLGGDRLSAGRHSRLFRRAL